MRKRPPTKHQEVVGTQYKVPSVTSLVLIAENEPLIVESLSFLITKAGFEVETAYDGAKALNTIREKLPDLVILDIMMPHLNGFDVLAEIRADPELEHIKVLMLTAKGQKADRIKAEELKADLFVTKPFSNKDLVEDIRNLLTTAQ